MLPVEGSVDLPFTIEGRPPSKGDPFNGDECWSFITSHYFDTFKIKVLAGRAFNDTDTAGSPKVVIINSAMAKKYWPKEDPIGRRISIGGKALGPEFEEGARQIVGVVESVRQADLSKADQPVMYVPQSQVTNGITQLANRIIPIAWTVRTSLEPLSLSTAVQRELMAVDGQMSVTKIRTMEQVIGQTIARQNFNMTLLSIFAGIALLLAAIGIYGLMSYTVEQRTQEIGIRMALGAGRNEMLRLVVFQGLKLAVIGVVLGLAAAFGLTRFLSKLLFGVQASDPATFTSVALILTAVALIASYVPAWRATKVDPLEALRYE
jgi:predicted permease